MDNKNNARLGKGLSSIFGQDVSKVLDDIQNGDITVDASKTFKEYIIQYQANAKNAQIKNGWLSYFF